MVLKTLEGLNHRNVWFAIDGPRHNNESDARRVQQCQDLISKSSLFNSDKVLIRSHNLGCKYGMAGALNWFFSKNEMGIVIEDDLVFDTKFLMFASQCLERFKQDKTVGSITGYMPFSVSNFQNVGTSNIVEHPFFSAWGWASWSDRWTLYDVEMKGKGFTLSLPSLLFKTIEFRPRYWIRRFKDFRRGLVDSWDFQFLFLHLAQNWKVIAPIENLVGNQGFGVEATHTKKERTIAPIGVLAPKLNLEEVLKLDKSVIKKYLKSQFGI
jgi:hypothetical protein